MVALSRENEKGGRKGKENKEDNQQWLSSYVMPSILQISCNTRSTKTEFSATSPPHKLAYEKNRVNHKKDK